MKVVTVVTVVAIVVVVVVIGISWSLISMIDGEFRVEPSSKEYFAMTGLQNAGPCRCRDSPSQAARAEEQAQAQAAVAAAEAKCVGVLSSGQAAVKQLQAAHTEEKQAMGSKASVAPHTIPACPCSQS